MELNVAQFKINLVDFSKGFSVENDNFEALKQFNTVETVNFYHNRIQDLNS